MKLLLRIMVIMIFLTLSNLGAEESHSYKKRSSEANSYEAEMNRFAFEEALTQYREGLKNALGRVEKYVKEHPRDTRAALALAKIYLNRDRQDLARSLYERVIKISPENREANRQLFLLYSWKKMPKKILKQYESLVARNPSDLKMRRILARKYVEMGHQQEAILQYEKIVKQAGDVESRKILADLYLWNERPREAARQYLTVLKTEPDNLEIIRRIADIYYDFSLYATAGEYYQKFLLKKKDRKSRERLKKIEEMKRPRMPAQYYYRDRGGNYTHSYYSWGYGQYLNDYFDYLLSYSRHRYSQSGKSVDANSSKLEVTNRFFNYLTFTEKAMVNNYSLGWSHLNGSLTMKKDFMKVPLSLESSISYEDIVSEIAAIDKGIEATFLEGYLYYNLTPLWSLTSRLKYGSYSDDNNEWETELGLIRHLKKEGPLIDLSYTYSRDSFRYPDSSAKNYPYWNPKNYEVHSLLFILSDKRDKKFSYLLHETLAWAVQDQALLNGFRLRGDYHFRKNWGLFADYSRTDTLTGNPEARFKEWRVKAGWNFSF